MAKPHDTDDFASRLLRQDEPLIDSQYQEYRARLEAALAAAERRLKITGWVAVASCALMFMLMILGASKLLGDFDPWSRDSTLGSVAIGAVYWLATATFFLSLASYYSRFRPGVRDAREQLRDAILLDLQQQLRELRELVVPRLRRDGPDFDAPSP